MFIFEIDMLFFVDQIDKHTLEISQADDVTYTNMQELADDLPGHSPRFVLLSYPLTLVRALFLIIRGIRVLIRCSHLGGYLYHM